MSVPKRPTILRGPVANDIVVTYSCPQCGEDLDYEDGFGCRDCGIDWGENPVGPGRTDGEWVEFFHELLDGTERAPLEAPAHLMIYREPDGYGAVLPTDHLWFAHLGCAERKHIGSPDCAFHEAVGDGQLIFMNGQVEVASGVVYTTRRFGTSDVPAFPSGVYLVESTGLALLPLRVVEMIAESGGTDGDDFTPDGLRLVHPETVPVFRHRRTAPPVTRPRGMVTVELPGGVD